MRHCVNGVGAPLASALTLNSLPIAVAAKTGTAQLRKAADGKDLLNSWVATFAPYDNPQIVLVIMAEDVHEGTVAVLPIAKEVLNWYFTHQDTRETANSNTNDTNENHENNDNNSELTPNQTFLLKLKTKFNKFKLKLTKLQNFLPAPANTNTDIPKPETGE